MSKEQTKLVKAKLENGKTIWVEARDLDASKKASKDTKKSDKQKK